MRNVVYLTDEKFAMPTCVSIISLIQNNISKAEYQIYVILNNVLEETRLKFLTLENEYTHIKLISVRNELYSSMAKTCLSKGIHVSETALFKFDIPNLLPHIDRVLYLDGDILINKDLTDLFEEDISNYYLAAVDDMGDEILSDGSSKLAHQIGISGRKYFNSGVMYLNLALMRKEGISEKLIDYRMNQLNFFMDQDALNWVLGNKRKELSYTYNFRAAIFDVLSLEEINTRFFSFTYEEIEYCLLDQAIIHMTDKRKPWVYEVPWLTKEFMVYYMLSPYKDVKLSLKSYVKAVNQNDRQLYKDLHKKYLKIKHEHDIKIWPFPFDKIAKDSKIVLYGAGNVGQDMYKQIMQTGYCKLVLWVDKNWDTYDENIANPEWIQSVEYDAIVIAIANKDVAQSIKDWLVSKGIERDKIIYE